MVFNLSLRIIVEIITLENQWWMVQNKIWTGPMDPWTIGLFLGILSRSFSESMFFRTINTRGGVVGIYFICWEREDGRWKLFISPQPTQFHLNNNSLFFFTWYFELSLRQQPPIQARRTCCALFIVCVREMSLKVHRKRENCSL